MWRAETKRQGRGHRGAYMPEKETKNDKPSHTDARRELFRALRNATRQVADDLNVGLPNVGLLVDCWGGDLFYAYRRPTPGKGGYIDFELLSDFREHMEAALKFLPEARNEYTRRLSEGIDSGLYELAIKTLGPLYKETGATYKRKTTILAEDPDDPEAPLIEKYVEKRELKHGAITRTRTNKGPGQHSKWTKVDLERVVQAAIALLPAQKDRTYIKILEIIKQFYPDKAPTSPEALRKLLDRFEIDIKEMKERTVFD
jgi:hypothetical protein